MNHQGLSCLSTYSGRFRDRLQSHLSDDACACPCLQPDDIVFIFPENCLQLLLVNLVHAVQLMAPEKSFLRHIQKGKDLRPALLDPVFAEVLVGVRSAASGVQNRRSSPLQSQHIRLKAKKRFRIAMGMDVDKARRHNLSGGILYRYVCPVDLIADLNDFSVPDQDVFSVSPVPIRRREQLPVFDQ